jgi:tetratricopeptide (TPR) repeat protein
MMRRFLAAAVLFVAAQALAGGPPGKGDAAALEKEISQELANPDAAHQLKAVADIHKLLDADPQRGAALFKERWLTPLMEAKQFSEIDDLCFKAIVADPADTPLVESLQVSRIRANLAAQKPDRALQQAKGFYNVSSMETTNAAILIVAECLNAAYPDDPGVVERFEEQQVAGAAYPATRPVAPTSAPARPPILPPILSSSRPSTRTAILDDPGDPVLAGIQVDPGDYRDAIAKSIGEDFTSLMGKGNLLLLAGRVRQAKGVFERAYAQAPDSQLAMASEALARQMKAEDGTIGRANAWIMSIRPRAAGNK